ncbi:MAG: hypothetical protein EHM12_11330 [Dehalococcoidia bacterium]|nr:MAG: hypothetical protein EHM12_11330 [Dehalococcoidia bacterium]
MLKKIIKAIISWIMSEEIKNIETLLDKAKKNHDKSVKSCNYTIVEIPDELAFIDEMDKIAENKYFQWLIFTSQRDIMNEIVKIDNKEKDFLSGALFGINSLAQNAISFSQTHRRIKEQKENSDD